MGLCSSSNRLAVAAVGGSALLGLGLVGNAWRVYQDQRHFIEAAWPTRAEVVALEPVGSDLSRSYPIASFTTLQGVEIRIPLPGSSLAPGDHIPLLYKEDDPENVRINSYWSLWFEVWAFSVAGGMLTVVPLAALALGRESPASSYS